MTAVPGSWRAHPTYTTQERPICEAGGGSRPEHSRGGVWAAPQAGEGWSEQKGTRCLTQCFRLANLAACPATHMCSLPAGSCMPPSIGTACCVIWQARLLIQAAGSLHRPPQPLLQLRMPQVWLAASVADTAPAALVCCPLQPAASILPSYRGWCPQAVSPWRRSSYDSTVATEYTPQLQQVLVVQARQWALLCRRPGTGTQTTGAGCLVL